MNYRLFGKTDLIVSETGFGAWAIGGPAQVGNIPIGWGNADDATSIKALRQASTLGINFFDTADFYGLGHSEELIGETFGNSDQVIIATKVGQKPGTDKPIDIDYSKKYILNACEASLKRLKRECIDYYQLHVARLQHLQQGECIEAMQVLQQQGKIRYWGISLFTFDPFPEAEWLMEKKQADGFQLVFNIINQRALPLLQRASNIGYGIIARMPLQFGLLSGKFSGTTIFEKTDHRHFRMTSEIIKQSNKALKEIWPLTKKYQTSKAALALSFVLSFKEISTVIPGIRNPEQAIANASQLIQLNEIDKQHIIEMYDMKFAPIVDLMKKQG